MITLFANTATDAHAEDAGGSGFPAFDMWHWPSQIFWLAVIFGLLYLALSRWILPKIATTIERRSSTVASDIDEAASLNDQAQDAEQALELELARARASAHETANVARDKIQAEISTETRKVDEQIEAQIIAAEQKISAMREAAMSNVEDIAAQTTEVMLTQLGRKASAAQIRDAVKSAL